MSASSRQRLRPWLMAKINSREIEGLYWLDKERKIFRIPWKHGGKQDWSPQDSRVFMEWARHTGKYSEGMDKPEWAKWKTRLRCAFNKARDIVEMKEQSDVDATEPFKVYMFKERELGKCNDHTQVKTKCAPKVKPEINKESSPIQPVIPDLEAFHSSKSGEMPSELQDLQSAELVKLHSNAPPIFMSTDSLPSFRDMRIDDQPLSDNTKDCDIPHTSDLGVDPQSSPYTLGPNGPAAVPMPHPVPITPSDVLMDTLPATPPTYHPTLAVGSPLPGDVPASQLAASVPSDVNNYSFEVPSPATSPLSPEDTNLTVMQHLPTYTTDMLGKPIFRLEGDISLPDAIHLVLQEETEMPSPLVGHEMHVRVQYLGTRLQSLENTLYDGEWEPNVVYEEWVKQPHGCRLFYGSDFEVHSLVTPEEAETLFGSKNAFPIHLPPCYGYLDVLGNPPAGKLQEYIQMLLDNLTRGVYIECDGGDIYATRLCRCVVYFCNEEHVNSVKLQRRRRTKIFDFRNKFKSQHQAYICNQKSTAPSTEVRLSFGQTSNYLQMVQSTYISAFITSAMAQAYLKEAVFTMPATDMEEMQISESDEMDNKFERIIDCNKIMPL